MRLVAAGAKELVIVAQDSTDYGRDWGEPNSLPRLLLAPSAIAPATICAGCGSCTPIRAMSAMN